MTTGKNEFKNKNEDKYGNEKEGYFSKGKPLSTDVRVNYGTLKIYIKNSCLKRQQCQ